VWTSDLSGLGGLRRLPRGLVLGGKAGQTEKCPEGKWLDQSWERYDLIRVTSARPGSARPGSA
jgi:hypothetical protein